MSNDIILIIDESVKLELNVSDIYFLFYKLFPEDEQFWWKLVLEEKNHAAIIKSGITHLCMKEDLPLNLVHHSLQELKDINNKLISMKENIENTPVSRAEAFNIAFIIETSVGELHFQKFMDEKTDSVIDKIFKELNKNDKEHAKRISVYMQHHGIPAQFEAIE